MSGDKFLGEGWGLRKAMADRGIGFDANYVVEALGNVAGGNRRGVAVDGLLQVGLVVDFAKAGLWEGGRFRASSLWVHGRSMSQRYVGDLFTASSIDAPDGVRLFELWFEQALAGGQLTLRAGQMTVDEEFPQSLHGFPFVNSTFGWPALIALNAPTPAYPFAIPGVRVSWDAAAQVRWRAGVYAGDPLAFHPDGRLRNRYGTTWSLNHGMFFINEWTVHNEPAAAQGAPWWMMALGIILHTGHFTHQQLDKNGLSLADPASSGIPMEKDINYGFYWVGERQLYRESKDTSQGLAMFARAGYMPGDRNLIEYYIEGGLTYTGLIPGRDADQIGLGIACGQLSKSVRRLARDQQKFSGTSAPLPDYEMVIEAGYRAQLRTGWFMQPTFQLILHPGGSTQIPDAFILGVRTELNF